MNSTLLDALRTGRGVVAPTLGPEVPPLTRAAVDYVIRECGQNGLVCEEKEIAVRAMLALNDVNELCAPGDLDVYGPTHGFAHDHAVDISELARKVP
jgi:hypothetical protein